MLSDITTLKMTGANFDSLTTFNFFDPHDGSKTRTVKAVLLYGKNGTGKSTIARAFRKLAGETIPAIENASFYDDSNKLVTITEEEKKHIFVYDEDYVDKNVRLKQDHLDTIIMLGPVADITTKIDKADKDMEAAKSEYDKQNLILSEYNDSNNVKSPKYYIARLQNALKGDDNWAGRDREINSGRQNTAVKDNTYLKFVSLVPGKSKAELLLDFAEKLKELRSAKSGALTINTSVPILPNALTSFSDDSIKQQLLTKIEKPELSEREKFLLELVQTGNTDDLFKRMQLFRRKDITQCPYCLQEVTTEYKDSLVKSIEKVLSKAVEDHRKTLRSFLLEPIDYDLSCFEKLDGYQKCAKLIQDLNTSIQVNNESINKKITNPYEPINSKGSDIKLLADKLNIELKELEKERIEYNKKSKRTERIIEELQRINADIAHYDVIDLANQFDKQQEEFKSAQNLYQKLKNDWDEKKKIVDELKAQRKNIKLAIDSMNACLKYIFFSDHRLEIIYSDGVYKLLSHGKKVRPCDVSAGERNIIGLSYFFTSIFDGKEEKDAYTAETLLVIDDPISSYDFENRIGILSFIKYKLSVFLEGNQNTKALLMTHDLMTFYDIHKILEEIIDSCKKKDYRSMPKFNQYEICNNKLSRFSYESRHEYTELIKSIYKYACGSDDEQELVIGNEMRQVLEAFSTFEYKKSIEKISTDDDILQIIKNPVYRTYFKNLMYRLVLHGGSHRAEQIKAMKDFRFFSLISEDEKRRTAKDILCFIYLLNSNHLKEHLKDFRNAESNIRDWCQEIEKRAAII